MISRSLLFAVVLLPLLSVGVLAAEEDPQGQTVQQQKELTAQTEALVQAYPRLGGFIDVTLMISPEGKVKTVDVVRNRTNDLTLETEILERMYRWQFTPEESGQQPLTITHRIAFTQQVDGSIVLYVLMGILGVVTVWWLLETPSQQ